MGGHAAPISMMQPIQPRCAHPFVVMARSEEPRQGVVSDFTLCTTGCEQNPQQRTAIALSWSLAEETRKSKTFHCNSLQPWPCLHRFAFASAAVSSQDISEWPRGLGLAGFRAAFLRPGRRHVELCAFGTPAWHVPMPEARGVDFEVLQVPFDVRATALAPAGADGHFLAYCPNSGFQDINLVEQKMDTAMSFTGSISPEFGLFPYSQGNSSWISFVENPPKSFVCYTSAGQVAGRTSFNQGTISAVCGAGEVLVALLVTTGHIRFVDLTTGKAAGKSTKLPDIPRADRPPTFFINQTQPRQVVVMRQVRPGADVHFWICELDELNNINTGGRRTLKIGAVAQSLGAFNDLESISAGSVSGELILCWKEEPLTNGFLNGKSHGSHPPAKKFCAAEVLGKEPKARRLGAFADAAIQSWHSIGTYFVEFWSQESDSAEAESAGTMKFRLRDSKFGMFVGAGDATLAKAPRGKLLVAASERFSVASTNGCFVGIRWTLPSYALQRSIGQGATGRSLAPNSEGTPESKKRKHQDTQNTEGLPDVNSVNTAFIANLIQLCQGPRTKDVKFLKQKLKPENLQFTLRTLVGWLAFRRDLSANVIRSSAPGIPATQQIVRFLSVLADAFLQSIVQLPTDDVQKAGGRFRMRVLEHTIRS